MRRSGVVLALGLLLGGCAPAGTQVALLTGELGCYAGGENGATNDLLIDPKWGTRFAGAPLMWPSGYTARDTGTAVVILDSHGTVKATTGRRYHISHAFAPSLQLGPQGSLTGNPPLDAFPVAVDCGYPWDFVDCTAAPDNQYCHEP